MKRDKDFYFPSSRTKNKKDYYIQRSIEILPFAITISFLMLNVYLSFKAPLIVAVFTIIFDVYWMIRVFYISTFLIYGYKKMKVWSKINWLEKCKKLSDRKADLNIEKGNIIEKAKAIDWQNIYHLVIIPTYKEPIETLEFSIDSIAASNYPLNRIIVVAAFEERAGREIFDKAKKLEEKYEKKFFAYITTIHPDKIPEEARVKGANATWAAKEAKIFLDEKGIKYENVIVSTFDSDTRAHPQYFACLSYQFATNPKRHQHSYQPLPLYNNNIWQTNIIVRVIMISCSFWQIMQSVKTKKMVTFSSHSMSFKTLIDVNYWPVDLISDDSIIFWKCYAFYNGRYFVQPIYIPISLDAVLAKTKLKTIINQYKQQRRWAWGIENIPLIYRVFIKNKNIPISKKIDRGYEELSGRISWGLTPVILAFFGWLPLMFGGEKFNQTILALNLPKVLSFAMILAMFGLVVAMFFSLLLLPPAPKKTGFIKRASMVFQWILSPLFAVPFGSFPMIDAQVRMFLGKYLEFWVTEKISLK